jgi:hypothetical protein
VDPWVSGSWSLDVGKHVVQDWETFLLHSATQVPATQLQVLLPRSAQAHRAANEYIDQDKRYVEMMHERMRIFCCFVV